MAGRKQGDVSTPQFWQDLLEGWKSSGQSIRAFCIEQGVSEGSFYAWRRALAARNAPRTPPAVPKVQGDDMPVFVPIRVSLATPRPTLEVVLGSGRIIRVPPDFDAASLRNLIAVLEEAPPC